MPDTVIQVENVGKKYLISHLAEKREQLFSRLLANKVKSAFRHGKKILSPSSLHRLPITSSQEEFWALRDVSFEIRQGDRVGIIGRNGAGKSTLLKILSRITEPTTGKITIDGRVASLLEVGTGFHSELTGRENIYLNGAILGMGREEIRRKFDEIVAFAEVEQFLDTPVKRYSSGMYVRLAFAVAAHLEPEILIVDEVLAVGDAQFQKKCLGKMEDVSTKEGRTVLFVSHNMGAISRLCSSALLLDRGLLMSCGETENLIREYMTANTTSSTVYELPGNKNKEMSLRRVLLNPESNKRSAEVRYDEPLVFRIEYDVNVPLDNCTVWIALQNMEGVIAFCTADYDMNPEKLGRRMPGYYSTDVLIPEKWLNVGEYSLIVGIVKNNPVIVYNREETLAFSVLEVGTPASVLREGVRKGVLQPFLRWVDVS